MPDRRRLLITLPDRISDWVVKGEIVDRYFNPGDVFDEIHVLLTNDDRPDLRAVQRMAGRASVTIHNVPAPRWMFVATLGWTPALVRVWARRAVRVGQRVRPDLVRCHGVRPSLVAAVEIARAVGCPSVVSLHSNPDRDQLRGRRATSAPRRLAGRLARRLEVHGLRRADLVLAVYEPIVPYLRDIGVRRFEVAYNVVAPPAGVRTSWGRRRERLRAVLVARQERGEKDPSPVIRAVAALPTLELDVVGDGPLHDELVALAAELGATDRVRFTPRLPNEEVLALLADADLLVHCSDIHEVSKVCIEGALTGLPIVVNDHGGDPAPELVGGHVLLVDGSAEGYREALARLAGDERERERLGRAALAYASERWDPTACERRVAELYEELLAATRAVS